MVDTQDTFRPYVAAANVQYNDAEEITVELVKFYLDDMSNWLVMVKEKFPQQSERITKELYDATMNDPGILPLTVGQMEILQGLVGDIEVDLDKPLSKDDE